MIIKNIHSSPVHLSQMCFIIWMIIAIMAIFPIDRNLQEVKAIPDLLTIESPMPNTGCDKEQALKILH